MTNTIPIFPILDQKLITLLKSLEPGDWNKPTVARQWTVKDVASHLLDGNMRTISLYRDRHSMPPDREIHSYADLVAFLNQYNADWVKATKRLSTALLIELLESTGKQYSEIMAGQDLHSQAIFPVSWAGEETSENWFHIAREYTEKWHHQQQIREAVGRPGIMERTLYYPFIETLLRGLPHTYRNTDAKTGTCIEIGISLQNEQLNWYLIKNQSGWQIEKAPLAGPNAGILIPAEIAWKLFTKAITSTEAFETSKLTGDQQLALVSLNLIAVMA
ncbi:maleylpyruvate isomerase N-terminal domain-containing protein [Dyadobacter sp. CY323]|uniref:maleylpyruvate isomerase N-terminal domain-containing protein n=1 Tax=Dyadobacter sp. CY323 TaxID=2907302 RepID=UPI001F3D1A57|nr:maleylpyruvate isomerase N-terminal domain-containing protein [Dyadobacter sp. CY323]MCE6987861.1 maleylpyruvate isomerase N-terminal domain-containing protein [Dyadobacter sp. CY323]